jgi:AraC-type transcriptional regulator N-terminus
MTLKLDRMQIAQLILDSQLPSLNSGKASRAIELGALSKPLFGAIERLINLLAEPECIPVLSPLVQKEIIFRLLTTECGPKIRQIATGGSHIHQISRVIDWIKGNLSERLRVEDLAGRQG